MLLAHKIFFTAPAGVTQPILFKIKNYKKLIMMHLLRVIDITFNYTD
jgi:hypothetical protein